MVKVALVDDHDIVAMAVESVVAQIDGLEFVGSAETVDDLLGAHPVLDIVVLDLQLPDGSSPAINVERLTAAGARVLVLTSGDDPYLIRSVADAPIFGLLRKSVPREVLTETMRRVAAGETELSAEWAAAIDTDPKLNAAGLSPQEQRVLTLFARGVKAIAVGYELNISPNTVEDYVKRIRAKYAQIGRPAFDKVNLYQRAVEDGFLPVPRA